MSRHFAALVMTALVACSGCGSDPTTPSSEDEGDVLVRGLVPELAWLAGEWAFDSGLCRGSGSPNGTHFEPIDALELGITADGDATLTVGEVVHQHRFMSGMGEGFCACWSGTSTYGMIRFSPDLEFMNTRLGRYSLRDLTVRGGRDQLDLRGTDTQNGCNVELTFHRS